MTRTALFASLLALALPATMTAAQHTPDHTSSARTGTIAVVGEGEFSGKPDRAEVTVGASAQAETAAEAQQQVNQVLTKVIAAVRGLELEGETMIQTAGISLSPVYAQQRFREGENQEPRIVGYRASNTVSVRTDHVDKIGDILDAAVKNGGNEVHGVRFMLRNEQRARLEALRRAVASAKEKGQAIAGAMGISLGRTMNIIEQGAQDDMPIVRGAEMMRMSADVSTPVEAGEVTIRARITAIYAMGSNENAGNNAGDHAP